MIPTVRLAALAALGLPLLMLGLLGRSGLWVALAYDGVLLAAVVLDRLALADPARLGADRDKPLRWVQGRTAAVRLGLRWSGGRRGLLSLKDLPPPAFAASGEQFRVALGDQESLEVVYDVTPGERGYHDFGPLVVRTNGPLGLLQRQAVLDLRERVRVYPDLVSLTAREAALVITTRHAGVRRGRLQGEGREFHQLRDYAPGDDVRLLDWKAFAHRGRPTVRDYRVERNQRVLLLIDAGRLMTARVADRLRFDWAVQAAGRLARVVLAFGDSVGLAFFSRELDRYLPPGKGPGHLSRVADLLSEAEPTSDEPDLGRALRGLLRSNPRRTLVVLFTEIADPRAAAAAERHVGALAPRHLGLVVSLADADLEAERDLALAAPEDVYRRVAADELWQDSRRTVRALEARGALVVRARADALAADTVERYLEVKRRGRL